MRKPLKLTAIVLALGLAAGLSVQLARPAEAGPQPQPHMRAALVNLKQARTQLEKATADKGGHRVKAMALIDQAIGEVEAGIKFDD